MGNKKKRERKDEFTDIMILTIGWDILKIGNPGSSVEGYSDRRLARSLDWSGA
jgi:hypothetical protein